MKTRQEVEDLKADWIGDPCWDIEDTDGFEEYRKELLVYRLRTEDAWKTKENERINDRARLLQCSPALVRYLENLESKIVDLLKGYDNV